MAKVTLPRGETVRRVRAAFTELGNDCTFAQMQSYLYKKYSSKLNSDSTFYTLRKELRGAKAITSIAAKTPEVKLEAVGTPQRIVRANLSPLAVRQLVTAAKSLVDNLGRDEAKNLLELF